MELCSVDTMGASLASDDWWRERARLTKRIPGLMATCVARLKAYDAIQCAFDNSAYVETTRKIERKSERAREIYKSSCGALSWRSAVVQVPLSGQRSSG